MRSPRAAVAAVLGVTAVLGCSGAGSSPSAPPCDRSCEDAVAVLALRETLKLVFNKVIQGQDAGPQNGGYASIFGGTAQVSGTATSNALQGTSDVQLTYTLDHFREPQQDPDPNLTYDMTLTGTLQEMGTLAVQPQTSTSIQIQGDAVTFAGTVYDPPRNYDATGLGGDGGDAGTDAGDAAADAGDAAGNANEAGTPGQGGTCPVMLIQNGNQVSGTICGRLVGVTL